MVAGDLVKMTVRSFWDLKGNPNITHTKDIATVIKVGTHIVEVMWPDGNIEVLVKRLFEVINDQK